MVLNGLFDTIEGDLVNRICTLNSASIAWHPVAPLKRSQGAPRHCDTLVEIHCSRGLIQPLDKSPLSYVLAFENAW